MKEIWKDVPEWENLYEVSNIGNIKSKTRTVDTCDKNKENFTNRTILGKILKCTISRGGYIRVDLSCKKTSRRKNALVHRLVGFAFIDNPFLKPHINHKDCNPLNNTVENLEWCTHKENMHHAFENGLMIPFSGTEKGENCPASKLKDFEVVEIKKRIADGENSIAISIDYPVSASAIFEIKAGRSWSHI